MTREEVLRNKILMCKIGSHLYGTTTEHSDVDFGGIFIANEDCYFGLQSIDEQDLSIKSKNESGKNNSDAVDIKLYEIRNFARLALQNNPNIIELLFVNSQTAEYVNRYGQLLLNFAPLFPHKGAYDRFIGYASSQKHKMIIKEKHFSELTEAYSYFSSDKCDAEYLLELRDKKLPFLVEGDKYFMIGDLNFQKHLHVLKVISMLSDRLSKITNRYELVLKHGYDTKFGSHLLRLLLEGEELLKTGKIVFPLQYSELLLDIKKGKYEIDKLLEMATEIEDRMRGAKEASILPSTPNYTSINEAIKLITKQFLLEMQS